MIMIVATAKTGQIVSFIGSVADTNIIIYTYSHLAYALPPSDKRDDDRSENNRYSGRDNDRYSGRDNDRYSGRDNDRDSGRNDRYSGRDNDRYSGRDNDRDSGRDNS